MHLALYFHAPGYQRGIAVQLGCRILAKVTFQCYFGSKSPAKTNMLMGSNTIGGYRSKNCTTLFALWTNLWVHVQPEIQNFSRKVASGFRNYPMWSRDCERSPAKQLDNLLSSSLMCQKLYYPQTSCGNLQE